LYSIILYLDFRDFVLVFQVKAAKPGILSEDLRAALGMGENTPPPWLINMQRYGPPPSYPDLKISGLNAPIPPGARFGYQAGGWGKPPVDEDGNPLYGDVFGLYEEESEDEQVCFNPPLPAQIHHVILSYSFYT
jgi:splicing factor 3B subunit 2